MLGAFHVVRPVTVVKPLTVKLPWRKFKAPVTSSVPRISNEAVIPLIVRSLLIVRSAPLVTLPLLVIVNVPAVATAVEKSNTPELTLRVNPAPIPAEVPILVVAPVLVTMPVPVRFPVVIKL